MNPQEKRQEVRNKIIAACPEIMELENRRYKFQLKGPGIQTDSSNSVLANVEGNKIEILGSPITLSHVLRTLHENLFHLGIIGISKINEDLIETFHKKMRLIIGMYNLSKDNLNDQSDELVAYLYDVLR